MYGNLNPNTNAWPFTPELQEGGTWSVVDNRNIAAPVVETPGLTFEEARKRAGELNSNHFRGA